MANLNYYNLQKAIYEKLVGSVPLMAVVSGVFDFVPQGTDFPYLVIGDVAVGDASNLAKAVADYQLNLHIWSRQAGHKQAADIMDMVYGLLHNGNIAVTGKTLVSMRVTSSNIELANDSITYHGLLRLRIILQDS